jgi:hypothetical protein
MPRFMIVRSFDVTEPEMGGIGRRSRELAEDEFVGLEWEHSHVVVDDEGKVKTYCVYAAPTEEMVRQHSTRLGSHQIDALHEIAGDVTPADFPSV